MPLQCQDSSERARDEVLRRAQDLAARLRTAHRLVPQRPAHEELCALSALGLLLEELEGGPPLAPTLLELGSHRGLGQTLQAQFASDLGCDMMSPCSSPAPWRTTRVDRRNMKDPEEEEEEGFGFSLPEASDSPASSREEDVVGQVSPQSRPPVLGDLATSDNQFYLHPERAAKLGWDLCALVLIFLIAIIIPVEICFWVHDEDLPGFFTAFDVITYFFFVLEMASNFFVAYHEGHGVDGRLITDMPSMARHYLKGWFAVDAFAIFPWFEVVNACVDAAKEDPDALHALKVIRMMKLLRVLKLGGLIQEFEEKILSARAMTVAFQLSKLSVVLLVLLHNVACLLVAMAKFRSRGYTWLHRLGVQDETRAKQYIASFYWATMTGTTVGFGDITPQSTDERATTVALMIASVVFVGQYLARFTAMVAALTKMENKVAEAKQDAIRFMKKRDVPREFQAKVLRYIETTHEEEAFTALDKKVMGHLSSYLQDQVTLAVTGAVLRRFRFFRDAEADFLTSVCQACRTVRAAMGDVIVREDHPAKEMYWVVRGEASVQRRGVEIGGLRAGDWFGELSLFVPHAVRCATVRCVTYCELMALARRDLQRSLREFPGALRDYTQFSQAIHGGDLTLLRHAGCRPRRRGSHPRPRTCEFPSKTPCKEVV